MNITELKDKLKKGVYWVVFKKKNGDERRMLCTSDANFLSESKLWEPKIKEDVKKNRKRDVPENLINIFDLEAKGWRSFYFENLVSIEKADDEIDNPTKE